MFQFSVFDWVRWCWDFNWCICVCCNKVSFSNIFSFVKNRTIL